MVTVFLSFTISLKAQEYWYSTMNSMQQAYINPAYIPQKKVNIGIANVQLDFGSGGIKIGDIKEVNDGKNTLSLQKLASSLNGDVKPYLQANLHTIDFSLAVGKGVFSAGHNVQFYGSGNIPKPLIDLAAYGNAQFIGQTLTANVEGSINAFQNFYLGYAHQFGKLSIGARANYLNGMYHFKSTQSKLEFTTSEDYYRLQLKSDYDFQSAGLLYYDNANDEFVFDDKIFSDGVYLTGNTGFSVDLGLDYQLSKSTKIYASILQLGKINWKERSNRYINKAEYEFNGFDLKDIVDGNTEFSIEDSLQQFLDLEESSEPFSSSLPVKLNTGVNYKLGKMDYNVGVQIIGLEQNHSTNFSISASRQLLNFLRLGVCYSIRPASTANLGLMLDLKLGPVRAYLATQNIASSFKIENMKTFGFISGFSIEFGKSNERYNETTITE